MNILGHEYFVNHFWGSSQYWTVLRGHIYAFKGLFFRPRHRMGDIFAVAKISYIFGCLKFLIFLG